MMNPEQSISQQPTAQLTTETSNVPTDNRLSKLIYIIAFLISCIGLSRIIPGMILFPSAFFTPPNPYSYDYLGTLITEWSNIFSLPFYFFVAIGISKVSSYSTAKSAGTLFFVVLVFLFGPLNLAGYYYDHIPRVNVSKTLFNFESKVDSGYYKNSLDAYNDCKNILSDVRDEVTQLDAAYTRNCLYKIALYFDDPMVCEQADENNMLYYNACRNAGNQCTLLKTFDADCLRVYSVVKQQDAKCDLIPDYKSMSTSSNPMVEDYHTKDLGNFPREFCKEKSQLKESSRFRQF